MKRNIAVYFLYAASLALAYGLGALLPHFTSFIRLPLAAFILMGTALLAVLISFICDWFADELPDRYSSRFSQKLYESFFLQIVPVLAAFVGLIAEGRSSYWMVNDHSVSALAARYMVWSLPFAVIGHILFRLIACSGLRKVR